MVEFGERSIMERNGTYVRLWHMKSNAYVYRNSITFR